MDFPAFALKQIPVTEEISDALGATPREAYIGRDLLCVFEDENLVRELSPNTDKRKKLDGLLTQVTAKKAKKGSVFDCISRSFAPKCSVAEDPVCGSGHCHIAPYWAKKLGKDEIVAYQASTRGGTLILPRGWQPRGSLRRSGALRRVTDLSAGVKQLII